MTRKDYILAAKVLRSQEMGKKQRKNIVELLSTMFLQDNPRFDKTRFADACDPEWDNPAPTKRLHTT